MVFDLGRVRVRLERMGGEESDAEVELERDEPLGLLGPDTTGWSRGIREGGLWECDRVS